MPTEFDPEDVVRAVSASVIAQFPSHDRQDIERRVTRQVHNMKDHPVTDYIAVLAEREVKKELKAESSGD